MAEEAIEISCDPAKRAKALEERGLDFFDAAVVFAGPTFTVEDDRIAYGETRYQTYGLLEGRMVMIVWTPRGHAHHVISMRHCHERESRQVRQHLGRPG